jgi:hypothetical protein
MPGRAPHLVLLLLRCRVPVPVLLAMHVQRQSACLWGSAAWLSAATAGTAPPDVWAPAVTGCRITEGGSKSE